MTHEPDSGKEFRAPSQESDPAWALLDLYFEPRNLAAVQARRAAELPEDAIVRQFRTLAVTLLPVIGGAAAIELLNTVWALHDRTLTAESEVHHLREELAQLRREVAALREPISHDLPAIPALRIPPESGVSHE